MNKEVNFFININFLSFCPFFNIAGGIIDHVEYLVEAEQNKHDQSHRHLDLLWNEQGSKVFDNNSVHALIPEYPLYIRNEQGSKVYINNSIINNSVGQELYRESFNPGDAKVNKH